MRRWAMHMRRDCVPFFLGPRRAIRRTSRLNHFSFLPPPGSSLTGHHRYFNGRTAPVIATKRRRRGIEGVQRATSLAGSKIYSTNNIYHANKHVTRFGATKLQTSARYVRRKIAEANGRILPISLLKFSRRSRARRVC